MKRKIGFFQRWRSCRATNLWAASFVTATWLGASACTDGAQHDDDVPPSAKHVGLTDVSVLFPLPTAISDAAQLLGLASPGNGGALLSTALFTQIEVFGGAAHAPTAYENWRIVAARIDPCFPDLAELTHNPSKCRRQLRLTAQPVIAEPESGGPADGKAYTHDAAIHLFYEFSEPVFREIATQWLALGDAKTHDPQTRLDIHPRMAAEGLNGVTAKGFAQLISKFAGDASLVQVAAMQGRSVAWQFVSLRRTGATLAPLEIPLVPESNGQSLTANENGLFDIQPPTTVSMQLEPLVGTFVAEGVGGGNVRFDASKADLARAMQVSATIDDPTSQFHPGTLDCATCHVATRARKRAATAGVDEKNLTTYQNSRDLTLVTPAALANSPQQVRAFGYRDRTQVLSQRVVNESAAVADALTTYLGLAAK